MARLALLFLALLQASAGSLTLEGQALALGTNTPVSHARIVVAQGRRETWQRGANTDDRRPNPPQSLQPR